MPDCSFERVNTCIFCPILQRPPLTETGDETLRNLKTRSQITPGEFTTHDTVSLQSSHYNHLSNPSLMYCRTYVNLYDVIRSVIPCDKLHKHQFSFNNDGQQRASFGWEREFQYGGNFSVSWDRNFPEINFGFTSEFSRTHGTMPPINFRVELNACFCRTRPTLERR